MTRILRGAHGIFFATSDLCRNRNEIIVGAVEQKVYEVVLRLRAKNRGIHQTGVFLRNFDFICILWTEKFVISLSAFSLGGFFFSFWFKLLTPPPLPPPHLLLSLPSTLLSPPPSISG